MHKTMNVLNCLPKSSQPKAKQSLHNIWQAETREDAQKAFDLFIEIYEPKYPKAALCLHKDRAELMAFYDFPAQHWQSIRTSNPIESAFLPVEISTANTSLLHSATDNFPPCQPGGSIKIELASGHHLTVEGGFDGTELARLLKGLVS